MGVNRRKTPGGETLLNTVWRLFTDGEKKLGLVRPQKFLALPEKTPNNYKKC